MIEKLGMCTLFYSFLELIQIHLYFQNIYIYCVILKVRVRVMVLNTPFNNISVISWQSVLLMEEPEKPTDLP